MNKMKPAKIKRDIHVDLWGVDAILPKGTVVTFVPGAGWCVHSLSLLKKLSGNSHDPKFRWVVINENEIVQEPAP